MIFKKLIVLYIIGFSIVLVMGSLFVATRNYNDCSKEEPDAQDICKTFSPVRNYLAVATLSGVVFVIYISLFIKPENGKYKRGLLPKDSSTKGESRGKEE